MFQRKTQAYSERKGTGGKAKKEKPVYKHLPKSMRLMERALGASSLEPGQKYEPMPLSKPVAMFLCSGADD